MDLKHSLTLLGLLSDLIGAALLSIPMIWDAREAANWLLRLRRDLRYFLYGPSIGSPGSLEEPFTKPDNFIKGVVPVRILAQGSLFAIWFGIIVVRLVYLGSARYRSEVIIPVPIANDALVTILMAMLTMLAVIGLVLFIRLPMYLARGLMWVARGNHERRLGAVGPGILCLGFVLQAAVNLM